MSPATRSRVWKLAAILCCFLALTLLAAAYLLKDRNAWTGDWPARVAVHRGALYLLSPLWDPPPVPDAEWIYDVIGVNLDATWPPYRHVGNAYSIGPTRWGARLHALVIPLWLLASVPAAAAPLALRRARRWRRAARGCCRKCGYNLQGIGPDTPCPECGRATGNAANTPES